MEEKMLLVFNTSRDEYINFNKDYSMEIPKGRIVAFDGDTNILYFGTDPIPCDSSKFVELTSGISFNDVQIITKQDYMQKYYDELDKIGGFKSDKTVHDYGDIGYESGTSSAKLMDLGIKFKITRN